MNESTWTVRLSTAAESDYREILEWTREHFGRQQVSVYAQTLSSVLQALSAGPEILGVKQRPELGFEIASLHVASAGRKGRHFIIFRAGLVQGQRVIDVLRLLHDSMDLQRHLLSTDPE